MRILTVRQPWAGAIIHRGKDVENRVRSIAGGYRGPVAIHTGLRFDYGAVAAHNVIAGHMDEHSIYGYGHIIGVVDLVGVHDSGDCFHESIMHAADLFRSDRGAFDRLPITSGVGGLVGRASFCSPWAQDGQLHMKLANPRPLAEPIPFKGALGLRTLDEATVALIAKQVHL